MAQVFKQNCLVRDNPPFGQLHSFKVGDKVPDWAEEQLASSPHLFRDSDPEEGVKRSPKKTSLSGPPVDPEPEPEPELKVPSVKASGAIWSKFANELSLDVPEGAKRDEIVALVKKAHPELFED